MLSMLVQTLCRTIKYKQTLIVLKEVVQNIDYFTLESVFRLIDVSSRGIFGIFFTRNKRSSTELNSSSHLFMAQVTYSSLKS